jgi:hypothetical protein
MTTEVNINTPLGCINQKLAPRNRCHETLGDATDACEVWLLGDQVMNNRLVDRWNLYTTALR